MILVISGSSYVRKITYTNTIRSLVINKQYKANINIRFDFIFSYLQVIVRFDRIRSRRGNSVQQHIGQVS